MTAPRIVVPGATTALTRRTTLRKAFLAPWDPLVDQCFLYSLADAQRHTGVAVHHSTLVVNHHHTSATPTHDNFPEFSRRLHRDVSCSLNTLLAARRYDAPRELFDDRPAHMMRLVDAEAQASHLVYEHINTVAAGLVQRPEHMPGRTLDFGLWKAGYVEVERPPVYFDSSRPERLRLELTPPPLLYRVFEGDLDALVYQMRSLAEDGIRALRRARTGPVVGARKLERMHPWDEPRTLRESGGERVPSFRIGARGIVGTTQRIEAAREVHAFRESHRDSRIARREGDLERRFPYGTYAARAYHGAPVEPEPPADALIVTPGPTLDDVKAELERERSGGKQTAQDPHALVDVVRDAWQQEAADVVEDSTLDLTEAAPVSTAVAAPARSDHEQSHSGISEAGEPHTADGVSPVVVRHRFDKRTTEAARRKITLRDRRRGRPPRPPRGTPRHGADPPG